MAAGEHWRDEKIDGVIYDMSPSPSFRHGIINNNINTVIKAGLKGSLCLVFMENLDFKYHPEVNDDYLCPDIMIVCDRKYLKGGSYSGVPRFVAETVSHSTAKRDKTEKKDIYEQAGDQLGWRNIGLFRPSVPWKSIISRMENMSWSRTICSRTIKRMKSIMGTQRSH